VEKASGLPLFEFLQRRLFRPLHMTSVTDLAAAPLGAEDTVGYLRHALGPLRIAPAEGKGWLFAAGQLAMTAHDLALWDISVIDRTVLRPASYRAMQTEVLLDNGLGTGYGLGVFVTPTEGRRIIWHPGRVSGYECWNEIDPDEHAAIAVLTNAHPGAAQPDSEIAGRIAKVIFESNDTASQAELNRLGSIFAGLQKGQIDRTLFSPNANAYFSAQTVSDYAASLSPLGAPSELAEVSQARSGGMLLRVFRIRCRTQALELKTLTLPDGKLEQYALARAQ